MEEAIHQMRLRFAIIQILSNRVNSRHEAAG